MIDEIFARPVYTLLSIIIFSLLTLSACGREGEIHVMETEITEATDQMVLPVNNCMGGAEITSETGYSVKIDVRGASELGVGVGAVKAQLVAALGVETALTVQHTVRTPAGWRGEHIISFQVTVSKGLITKDGSSGQAAYTVRVPESVSDVQSHLEICPTTPATVPPATTSIPPTTIPVVTEIEPDADLSVHYWTSRGGGSSFLEESLHHYRAGVSHIEDLPVAGQSITLLTFDTSALRGRSIVNAWLDLSRFDVIGDPFGTFDGLLVEEVSYADFGFDVINSPSQREISRLSRVVSELDVTQEVEEAIGRGSKRFQLRLRCADVAIANELTQPDDYVEWDGIRLVVESQ